MEKAWNIVKMIFASVDRGYLIRSYILGFLYMAIVVAPHTFMYWHEIQLDYAIAFSICQISLGRSNEYINWK